MQPAAPQSLGSSLSGFAGGLAGGAIGTGFAGGSSTNFGGAHTAGSDESAWSQNRRDEIQGQIK